MRNAEVLSVQQINAIHEATLDMLATVGVRVDHPLAKEIVHAHGAEIAGGNIVKITSDLVAQALSSAPAVVKVYTRAGEPAMTIGGDNQYYGGNVEELNVLDETTGQVRKSVSADRTRFAKLMHGLEHFDFMMCGGAAADVPYSVSNFLSYTGTAVYTDKPLIFSATLGGKGCAEIRTAAAILAGGEKQLHDRPCIINLSDPFSPLVHVYEGADNLIYCAEHGIPILYLSYILMGMTGPVTFLGALAQAHAECLSALVIHQLVKPGSPFIYSAMPSPVDMRTTIGTYASPELHMLSAAAAQIASHCGLPFCGTAGTSESMSIDAQALAEATMSLQSFAYSKAHLAHDVGSLYHCSMASVPFMVLLNETIAMIKALTQDIPLGDEQLALDVIRKAGPGGNFLSSEHTFRNFKQIWYPRLFDRSLSGGGDINGKVQKAIQEAMSMAVPCLSKEQLSLIGELEQKWKRTAERYRRHTDFER